MNRYEVVRGELRDQPRRWLVTGAAGFIGSALVEELLGLGQQVRAIDNFATGHQRNLDDVLAGATNRSLLTFEQRDIRSLDDCQAACAGVDVVLHQAALGSVPRSINNPLATHQANVDGFFNMLLAARDAGVDRFVYAASSSTYGDHPALPKQEDRIGKPLSPYAVTKYVNELYAEVFQRTYGLESIGLRYFNVFGRRQDPDGAYAAVIPLWVGSLLRGVPCRINGDGETSRDFCYVDNAVQANLLAALAPEESTGAVYNVAFGQRTTLNDLFRGIRDLLAASEPAVADAQPEYVDFRAGDVRHSLADISRARERLGYEPQFSLVAGLREALPWYVDHLHAAPVSTGAAGTVSPGTSPGQ
jgi:UDP-N-acetylglucosamine 4-epimerase